MDSEISFVVKKLNERSYAEITLNRPTKGNSLTLNMLESLHEILNQIEVDPLIKAVVVRSEGKFFCTGGDITAWGSLSAREMGQTWILRGIDILTKLTNLPKPVIAVIHGHAIGGGLELALNCDFRLVYKEALFGTPEVGIGMIAGWNGIRRLTEIIGPTRAKELTLSGKLFKAEDARTWGLFNSVSETVNDLNREAETLLIQLLSNSSQAMAETKALLNTIHLDLRHQHAAAAERAAQSDDCLEGVTAFKEKRKPNFKL
jgi:enoyl-CoA hydratase/carnithine racemase